MTTNTCRECSTRLTARNRCASTSERDLCAACYECDDELRHLNDQPPASVDTGRKNRSHAACDHARTATARARCRAKA